MLAENEETGIYLILDSKREQFDKLLVEAIDETLCSLGEPVKNTLYQNLETFCISKCELPAKIVEFSRILHKIFGLGASRLEIKCMKNLNSKIQENVRGTEADLTLSKWIELDKTFEEYVSKMRVRYEAPAISQ